MKKLNIKEFGFFYLAIIVSLIFAGLLIYDAYNIKIINVSLYKQRTDAQAKEYMKIDELSEDTSGQIIEFIDKNFNTSASVYCIVSDGDEIVFVKDKQTTSKLKDSSYSKYMADIENGNEKYIVSTAASKLNDVMITIVSKEEYIVKQGKYDLLIQHVHLYSILFALACVAIAYFQMRRRKRLAREIGNLHEEMAVDRKHIESLVDKKNNEQNADMNNKSSGFMSKKTMEAIVNLLTDKQKNACCKIMLKVSNEDELLKMVVLLDRTSKKGCISCLYEENTFMIILLNANNDDAKIFISTLDAGYRKSFQETIPVFDIQIDSL